VSEKKNWPQWLREADTSDADVEIKHGVVIWKGGIWQYGTWQYGTWEDGIWEDGIWQYGTWQYGIWKGGTWKGGLSSPLRCRWCVMIERNDVIHIGCVKRTIKEWDEFFYNSDEVIEYPRDTDTFRLIERSYRAAKAALIGGYDE
jgi:hypothetical protein